MDKELETEETINNQEETEQSNSNEDNSVIERNYEEDIKLLKDQLLRAVAEGENIRKRAEKQVRDASDYSISSFAKDLISVMENLQRASLSINNEAKNDDPLVKSISEGVEMTKRELINVFEKHGIMKIDPLKGDKFDHNYHQAVAHVADPEVEAGNIISVMQSGYVLKDRLLVPAMVSVAKSV
ncbi:MAG: nucleotide exchange factor GrpE [Alphaproteobacteria bacterium]